jgi:hypothetical protein
MLSVLVFYVSSYICREDLERFSKDYLLEVCQNMQIKNREQALTAIYGAKQVTQITSCPPSQRLPFNRDNSDSSQLLISSLSRTMSYRDKPLSTNLPSLSPDTVNNTVVRKGIINPDNLNNRLITIAEAITETNSNSVAASITSANQVLPHQPLVKQGTLDSFAGTILTSSSKAKDTARSSSHQSHSEDDLQSKGMVIMRGDSSEEIVAVSVEGSRENSNRNLVESSSAAGSRSVSAKKRKPNSASLSRTNSQISGQTPRKGGKNKKGEEKGDEEEEGGGRGLGSSSFVPDLSNSNDSLGSGIMIPGSAANTSRNSSHPNTSHLPPKKISDIKAPSKALQQFDEFMTSLTIPSKAVNEGRKKANRTSRFRLPTMIENDLKNNNISSLINIYEIQKDRLKMELTLFQAMNPHYTKKDKEIFIETFKRLNPTVTSTINDMEQQVDDVLYDIQQEIVENTDAVKKNLFDRHNSEKNKKAFFLDPLTPGTGKSSNKLYDPSPASFLSKGKSSSAFSFNNINVNEGGGGDLTAASPALTNWDETNELQKWQEYTLLNIIQAKNSERKTLPLVALPKNAGLSGKRYRSQKTGGNLLVTLPAKSEEESISGPTGYLELYKTSFNVKTSSKAKERVLKELKGKSTESTK